MISDPTTALDGQGGGGESRPVAAPALDKLALVREAGLHHVIADALQPGGDGAGRAGSISDLTLSQLTLGQLRTKRRCGGSLDYPPARPGPDLGRRVRNNSNPKGNDGVPEELALAGRCPQPSNPSPVGDDPGLSPRDRGLLRGRLPLCDSSLSCSARASLRDKPRLAELVSQAKGFSGLCR